MQSFRIQLERLSHRLILVAGAVALTGCASVEVPIVETGHLDPVVQRYPVTAGVYFDGEIQDYLHTEERPGGNDWEIFLGDAQATLFERIMDASFEQHLVIENLDTVDEYDVDLVIYPKIVEYAYLAPEDSGSDFYAVSIKYAFKVFDDAGDEITNWTVTAYGKNRSSLGRGKASLSEATNIALRDAAAAVIIELESNGELVALLNPDAETKSVDEPVLEDEAEPEAAEGAVETI